MQDPDDSLLMSMRPHAPIQEAASTSGNNSDASAPLQSWMAWLTTAVRISAANAAVAGLAHGDVVTLQKNLGSR